MNPMFFEIIGYIILMALYSFTIIDLYKLKSNLKKGSIVYEKDRVIDRAISKVVISSIVLFFLLLLDVMLWSRNNIMIFKILAIICGSFAVIVAFVEIIVIGTYKKNIGFIQRIDRKIEKLDRVILYLLILSLILLVSGTMLWKI